MCRNITGLNMRDISLLRKRTKSTPSMTTPTCVKTTTNLLPGAVPRKRVHMPKSCVCSYMRCTQVGHPKSWRRVDGSSIWANAISPGQPLFATTETPDSTDQASPSSPSWTRATRFPWQYGLTTPSTHCQTTILASSTSMSSTATRNKNANDRTLVMLS